MHALVDGHNAIGRLSLTGSDPEATRRTLLQRVLKVTADATVFFDAQGAPAAAPTIQRDGGLEVRFCRAREADEEILRFVRAAAQPAALLVVTDDRELAGRARQLGAKSAGIGEFFGATQRGQTPLGRSEPMEAPDASSAGGSGGGGKPLTAADFGLPQSVDLSRPGDWFNVGDPLLSSRAPSTSPTHAPSATSSPARASPAPAPGAPADSTAAVSAPRSGPEAEAKARALAAVMVASRPVRHVFLCAEPTKPKCAPPEVSRPVWEHLKQRVKELGLDALKPDGRAAGECILRTKADCLRVCNDGPIAVVYPDGIWYRGVTVPVMERILLEHVIGGRPVESHVLARLPLL